MNNFAGLSGKIHLGPWSFNVIDISDLDMYKRYIRMSKYPTNLWTSNFDFIWAQSQSDRRKTLWKIVDNMLVTFSYLSSGKLYLLSIPYGDGNHEDVVEVLYKCMHYCYKWNDFQYSSTVLRTVNSIQLEFLKKSIKFRKYFKTVPLTGKEKHFSIEKLIHLPGKDFETIRRKINKFKRLCPDAIVRRYRNSDYNDIMKLGEHWSSTSGQKYSYIIDDVYFPKIIKHCMELDHTVLVVESQGKMLGMVSGGPLPSGQSWWCISKFINDFDGLSEFLIVELAKEIHRVNPSIELMNAGEDLGMEGLRFFKQRFRPVLDLKKYVIYLREPKE